MRNLYERIEHLGGMIKKAGLDPMRLDHIAPTAARLKDGRTLMARKPIANGRPLQTGVDRPAFHPKLLSNDPYNLK